MVTLKPSRIVTTFAVVSALWILFSDNAASFLFSSSPKALLWANTLKGWLYVMVVSSLLLVLLKRYENQSAKQSLALRESEERFRTMFERHGAIMLLIEPESGRIIDANDAAAAFYGYSRPALRSMFVHDLNALLPDEVLHERDKVLRGETTYFVFPHTLANGESRTVEVYSNPVQLGGENLLFSVIHDITDRKRIETDMADSLREKEIMLREIHHRVKNNLQIISSLLSLQEHGVDQPAVLDVLAESRARIASMAMVHEQLYRSPDFTGIDLEGYIRQFLPSLVASYKGEQDISLEFDLAPITLTLEQAIPFGLTLNELATNALKHGFKDRPRGTLRIAASSQGGQVILEIEDDGVGLPPGFSLGAAGTLGLQLVVALTNQMHGEISAESSHGARFRIIFPIAPAHDCLDGVESPAE